MGNNLTIRDVLKEGQRYIDSDLSYLESHLILSHTLNKPRSWLVAHDDEEISENEYSHYISEIKRRASGCPIAYLLGSQEFWSLDLKVTESTLIPRPETECLVEAILDMHPKNPCSILDLGTGSGAIALALASEHRRDTVFAMDQSTAAIAIARENGQRLNLENVHFFVGQWGDSVAQMTMDIVVSNPPYIRDQDDHLPALEYEPRSALTSGPDGLKDIKAICRDVRGYLKPGGILAVEHGYDQQDDVLSLFAQHGFTKSTGHQDLQGVPRFVTGIAP